MPPSRPITTAPINATNAKTRTCSICCGVRSASSTSRQPSGRPVPAMPPALPTSPTPRRSARRFTAEAGGVSGRAAAPLNAVCSPPVAPPGLCGCCAAANSHGSHTSSPCAAAPPSPELNVALSVEVSATLPLADEAEGPSPLGAAAATSAPGASASGADPKTLTYPGSRAMPTSPALLVRASVRGPHQAADAQLEGTQPARLVCSSRVVGVTGPAVAPAKAAAASIGLAFPSVATTSLSQQREDQAEGGGEGERTGGGGVRAGAAASS